MPFRLCWNRLLHKRTTCLNNFIDFFNLILWFSLLCLDSFLLKCINNEDLIADWLILVPKILTTDRSWRCQHICRILDWSVDVLRCVCTFSFTTDLVKLIFRSWLIENLLLWNNFNRSWIRCWKQGWMRYLQIVVVSCRFSFPVNERFYILWLNG